MLYRKKILCGVNKFCLFRHIALVNVIELTDQLRLSLSETVDIFQKYFQMLSRLLCTQFYLEIKFYFNEFDGFI